ncbi:MAG: hypothetical protein HY323_05400 [Betaproteobacteria bacterium]|nr:hypothetical protein [Betaproteobacteria bacterium]
MAVETTSQASRRKYGLSAAAKELNARSDEQPLTVRCMIDGCRYRYSGTAAEARERVKQHRRRRHPGWPVKAPKPSERRARARL